MVLIGIGILSVILLAVGSIIVRTLQNGVPPMPSSYKVRRAFLKSFPLLDKGTIFELGAGWGSLAFPLAQSHPNCSVVALENSLIPFLVCRLRLFFQPVANLKILYKNFYEVSLKDADIVVCYLYPGAMQRLSSKFQKELRPDAIIATHTFAIAHWPLAHTETVDDLYKTRIYHYRPPH